MALMPEEEVAQAAVLSLWVLALGLGQALVPGLALAKVAGQEVH